MAGLYDEIILEVFSTQGGNRIIKNYTYIYL